MEVFLELPNIAKIMIRTSKPLFIDKFKDNRQTGAVILVDEFSNETVAAGMII